MILHPLTTIPVATVLVITASSSVIAVTDAEKKAVTDAEPQAEIATLDQNVTLAKEIGGKFPQGNESKVTKIFTDALPKGQIDLENSPTAASQDEGEHFFKGMNHFPAANLPATQDLHVGHSKRVVVAADNYDLNRVLHSFTGNSLLEPGTDIKTNPPVTSATDEEQNLGNAENSVEETPRPSQSLDFKKEVLIAEEGGSGYWLPGAAGSLAGVVPAQKGLYFQNQLIYYSFSASASRAIPIGGEIRFGLTGDLIGDFVNLTYVTGTKVLGGDLAVGLAVPLLYTDVSAELVTPNQRLGVEDSAFGLSDIVINPLVLGWRQGNFNWLAGISVFAPTGDYTPGSLAQLSKNYWSFGPYAGFTYLNLKSGLEASILGGITFNTENLATDYDSGDQLHIDWLVAKHFPNRLALGVTGFIYQQITGDSGAGAVLGDFRGRTFSVGPSVRYSTAGGVGLEFKWLPEFAVQNRPSGNLFYFNVSLEL